MGKPNFSDEFKRDAVAQIIDRGYRVAEVSRRLGVSPHSLYAWKRQLARQVSGDAGKDAEIRQLKRELARMTEERHILKKPPRISPSVTSFRQGCKVRYAFVAEHRGQFKVRSMCRCLHIQPSGAVSPMRTRLHWMNDVLECLRSAGERLPLGQSGRAANFEGLAIDEVALLGKVIVDGGVDGCELLQCFHLPKSEHRPLSSPER